ncbi:MAG: hypothetical protein Q9169_001604 [Polycauliona sp. 2 TL-2023]
MHFAQPSPLLALAFTVGSVLASPHGQAHGPRRRYNDDGITATEDLALITDAPGPPTVQPGIPLLQPSIPTTGVASLDIPPVRQTPSWRSSIPSELPSKDAQPPDPVLTSPLTSTPPNDASVGASVSRSASTTTSIPYLSELMSQLFSQSTNMPAPSANAPYSISSAAASKPELNGTPSKPLVTSRFDTSAPIDGDPENTSPASTPSMLIYSLTLPPYSNGLETSGIVESLTRSSPAEDKDKPPVTVYSYNLPPYTPKVPTYVATSAGTAPLDMTSGAPGGAGGAAPTDRNFLAKGFVDPQKDPVAITSPMVPLYSPACLGNAYGGGYVITPTLSVANTNATGISNIPPAYGFSYKFEPTISPGYGGAVVVVDTKAPVPTGSSHPYAGPFGNDVASHSSKATQSDGANPGNYLPPKDAPTTTSKGFVSTPSGSIHGISSQDSSITSLVPSFNPSYGSSAGAPPFGSGYNDPLTPSQDTWVTNSGYNIPTTAKDPQNTINAAGSPIGSSVKGYDQSSGHPSVLATRVTSIIATTSTTWCPSTAPDHLSIISSILGDVPLSTAITGSEDMTIEHFSDKDAYPMDTSITPSTALAAVTIGGSPSIRIESVRATVLPQDEFQIAAVAFDSTATDMYGTVSAQHLSSKINSTFVLSGDEPGVTPFGGKSTRLTASMLVVFMVVSCVCLLSSYA